MLYAIVKPEADARKLSLDKFMDLLEGPAIGAAEQALMGEIMDFFQQRKRGEQAAAIKKALAGMRVVVLKATDEIDNLDLEKAMAGGPSGASPVVLALTPPA
jgi:hypothetical protein